MAKNLLPFQQNLPCENTDLATLTEQLLDIRNHILQLEAEKTGMLAQVLPQHRNSARNLIHYLALRTHDIRELQANLIEWGFSSLGRCERKVQATLDTLLHIMHELRGMEWQPGSKPPSCFREGRILLEGNTQALLGDTPSDRRVRIMVTMPDEAAQNYGFVKDLLFNGMNCARINCAHGNPETWAATIANIRKAAEATNLPCEVEMDLSGPKLRTGPLQPGPAVLKMKPLREKDGKLAKPGVLWLYTGKQPPTAEPGIPLPGKWENQLRAGDKIRLRDARNAKRILKVVSVSEEGCRLSHKKTIYLTPGLQLSVKRKFKGRKWQIPPVIPAEEGFILLQTGDLLKVRKDNSPGKEALKDEAGMVLQLAEIGCSIPSVLDEVKAGESIWFDDGKIEGRIEKTEADHILVRILHTGLKGAKLRSEKGINLPDSDIHLPALTPLDLQHLGFAAKYADIIGLSFVNTAADVTDFIHHINVLTDKPPGIILKIETRKGFVNLPEIILAGMALPVQGIMIARGDLAIECGFGRLAEVQEEILWICEAAHVPAIWATQVLEGLAKEGLASRAEITDAAMGQRAECIMLNKGNHIIQATRALDDILRRMQDHQTKKRSLLRKLQLAESFFVEKGNLE